jgi:two-component system chemotaxis response regulator CheB
LASLLDQQAQVRVVEAEAGMVLRPNTLHIARGGSHLLLGRGPGGELITQYRSGSPVNGVMPAVDMLFQSAQRVCGGEVIALLLTGMGADGVEGLRGLKQRGAHVLVQNEATSVVWGMPGAAVRAGVVDEVVSLEKMGRRLAQALR